MATAMMMAQAAMAVAADPAALRPVAPWAVEYATNMCVLSRGFGGTVQAPSVSLAIRPLPLSTRAEMIVAIPSTAEPRSKRGKMKVTLLPSGEELQVPYDRWRNAASGRVVASFDVPVATLEAMRNAQAIGFALDREPPIRVATGSTARPLDALVPCQDDLLKAWGYDPAIRDRIAVPAAPVGGSLGAWFGYEYYPAEALRLGQEGRTTISWTIDATGKTRDCRVLDSSGSKPLDLTTCAIILQKARFRPARDRDNNPIESYQVQAIRWFIAP